MMAAEKAAEDGDVVRQRIVPCRLAALQRAVVAVFDHLYIARRSKSMSITTQVTANYCNTRYTQNQSRFPLQLPVVATVTGTLLAAVGNEEASAQCIPGVEPPRGMRFCADPRMRDEMLSRSCMSW